jgi:hypothetical protein
MSVSVNIAEELYRHASEIAAVEKICDGQDFRGRTV